jgi:hypothetical protein
VRCFHPLLPLLHLVDDWVIIFGITKLIYFLAWLVSIWQTDFGPGTVCRFACVACWPWAVACSTGQARLGKPRLRPLPLTTPSLFAAPLAPLQLGWGWAWPLLWLAQVCWRP